MPANTDATFDEVASSGPACPPLPFPEPTFTEARRLLKPVHVPDSSGAGDGDGDEASSGDAPQPGPSLLQRTDSMAGNVLVPLAGADAGGSTTRAYWIQRKLNKTTYGTVRVGYVLRPREKLSDDEDDDDDDDEKETSKRAKVEESIPSLHWEVTPYPGKNEYEMVAIKMFDRSKVKALIGRRMENPMVDLYVSQLLAEHSPDDSHVLGTLDVLADSRFIYEILPFCGDGTLFEYIERMGPLKEGAARHFFRQILKGLGLLQQVGLCHRDLCLEHVLLRDLDCFIVGMGKCLQVPYSSSGDGSLEVTDVSEGTVRRLILPQGQCGRPHYMAPEVLTNKDSFDGYAVDVWATAIMLFYMLFGDPPFVWAGNDDPKFEMIAVKGDLEAFVKQWTEKEEDKERSISDEAVDLLQKMLQADPKDRLSLRQVVDHPWVILEDGELPAPLPEGALNVG